MCAFDCVCWAQCIVSIQYKAYISGIHRLISTVLLFYFLSSLILLRSVSSYSCFQQNHVPQSFCLDFTYLELFFFVFFSSSYFVLLSCILSVSVLKKLTHLRIYFMAFEHMKSHIWMPHRIAKRRCSHMIGFLFFLFNLLWIAVSVSCLLFSRCTGHKIKQSVPKVDEILMLNNCTINLIQICILPRRKLAAFTVANRYWCTLSYRINIFLKNYCENRIISHAWR